MNLKLLSAVVLAAGSLALCSAAYADQNCGQGAYFGGQFGYGNANYDVSVHGYSEGDLGGRGYVGYQFNPNFSLETGYTVFADNTFSHSSRKFKTEQWDILAKAGMPFGNGFRGDVKAGVARVNSSMSEKIANVNITADNYEWDPAAGASVSYSLNKNFAVDVSYLHAFGSNDFNSPSTDLATVGVSYSFA